MHGMNSKVRACCICSVQPLCTHLKPAGAPPPRLGTLTPTLIRSRPGSPRKIHLDFDGCVITNSQWNDDPQYPKVIVVKPYSSDADRTTFSDQDKRDIISMWRAVAEDYGGRAAGAGADAGALGAGQGLRPA